MVALPWLRDVDGAWLAEVAGDAPIFMLDNHYVSGGQGDAVLAALAADGPRGGGPGAQDRRHARARRAARTTRFCARTASTARGSPPACARRSPRPSPADESTAECASSSSCGTPATSATSSGSCGSSPSGRTVSTSGSSATARASFRLPERLCAETGGAVSVRRRARCARDCWRPLAFGLRQSVSYLRYLSPAYRDAGRLRERWGAGHAPRRPRPRARPGLRVRSAAWRRCEAGLRRVEERSSPRAREIDAYLAAAATTSF